MFAAFSCLFCLVLYVCCVDVDGQSQDTINIPFAKKSIFATSDANRVSTFISKAFEPLISNNKLEQLAFDDFICGSPSKFRFDSGFELHSPYTPYHSSGGFEVEFVESHYGTKWENLLQAIFNSNDNKNHKHHNNNMNNKDNRWHYDAILDNSMTFWVTDLADFDGYNEDYVDRLYFKWQLNGKTYYSMFIHNGKEKNDLNQFELISDRFSSKTESELGRFKKMGEPRAFIDEINANYGANYGAICESGGYDIVSIGIKRAVSDLEANLDWYKNIFSATITDIERQILSGETVDVNGNLVKYGHILMDSRDGYTVSFFERVGVKDTFGGLKISDLENGLNKAHNEVMTNPFCCVDRWYDMHYAIPMASDESLSILEKVMKSGDVYMVYFNDIVDNEESTSVEDEDEEENEEERSDIDVSENQIGMFWTLVEPNGQMVQIPGTMVDINDWTTFDGSMVEFYVDPTIWDGNWCEMANTREYDEYEFGDDIATIVINNNNKDNNDNSDKDNKETKNSMNKLQQSEMKNEKKTSKKIDIRMNDEKELEEFDENGFVEHEYGNEIDANKIAIGLKNLAILSVSLLIIVTGIYYCTKERLQSKIFSYIPIKMGYPNIYGDDGLADDIDYYCNGSYNYNTHIEYTYKTFESTK